MRMLLKEKGQRFRRVTCVFGGKNVANQEAWIVGIFGFYLPNGKQCPENRPYIRLKRHPFWMQPGKRSSLRQLGQLNECGSGTPTGVAPISMAQLSLEDESPPQLNDPIRSSARDLSDVR